MSFCPYCGKQVEAGEICSCTTGAAPQSAPAYPSAPAAQPRPAAPTQSAPRPAAPRPAAPRPAGSYPSPTAAPQRPAGAPLPETPVQPREEFSAPRENVFSAPRPSADFFGGKDDFSDIRDDFDAPQAPAYGGNYGQPDADYSQPTRTAGFTSDLNELLGRVTRLLRGNPEEVLRESIDCEGTSWLAVFGAYVLFGTLAACFAIPRFMTDVAGDFIQSLLGSFASGVFKYGDFLSASFGGILWRSLLINILTVGIIIAAVMAISGYNKSKLPMSGTLNLTGIAFVPAAALNVLGFVFSFFFPAGTLLCGIVSAVCTIVIVLTALSAHSGKSGLWVNIIAVCAVIAVYCLLAWLLMNGFLPTLFSGGSGSGNGLMF